MATVDLETYKKKFRSTESFEEIKSKGEEFIKYAQGN